MNTLLWHLARGRRRLGATGLVGLVLLGAALVLQVGQVESVRRATLVRVHTLASLRVAAVPQPVAPAAPALNPLADLPPTGAVAQQIGELDQLAHLNGIDLPRGQYSVTPVPNTSLLRWQLVLPIEAPYPALHAFLATALERQPNLTLDELKLKRERIESSDVLAELRLNVFLEATP
jgi:hypothetical protein